MEGGGGRTRGVTALKILHDSHDVGDMGDGDDGDRFEIYMRMAMMMNLDSSGMGKEGGAYGGEKS